MKKTKSIWTLAELLLMIAVLFVPRGAEGISLPLAWVGKGLRFLSLSGSAGNLAAIVLYIMVSLLPLLLLLKKKRHLEDLLLPVASAVLFYALYAIINPGHRPMVLMGEVGNMVLELTVYSILAAWIILRVVRSCRRAEQGKLYSVLGWMLFLLASFCVIAGVGSFESCRQTVAAIREGNTAPGTNLAPTFFFVYLRTGVQMVEYGLTAWILLLADSLMTEIKDDPYGEKCCQIADRVAKWCRISLIVTMLMMGALNVGQLLFAERLHYLNTVVHIPFVGVTVTLVLMAVTGLLRQGKRLKQDNDLFI